MGWVTFWTIFFKTSPGHPGKELSKLGLWQGCQIFLGTTYQNGKKCQITIKLQNGRKIDQMAAKYTIILHCITLQNLPKFEFLV
jgi:hypothetical protein